MSLVSYWNIGLTPEMVKIAEKELQETPHRRKEALEEFKKLIDGVPNFSPYADDSFLIRFLRVKKYNVQKAFKTFQNYYAYKARYSRKITDLSPSDVKSILELDRFLISPKRDKDGGGIIIAFLGNYKLDTISPEQYLAAALVCAEIGQELEASQVCGTSGIFDLKGISLARVGQFCSPTMLSLFIRGVQDCWPYRINAFHVVNEPSYFNFTYSFIKPMLSKKLRDRVYFHGTNLESLHRYIPAECLPKELGGPFGTKDFLDFRSNILIREPLMQKINEYVYQGN